MRVPTNAEVGQAMKAVALAIVPLIAYTYAAGWYTGKLVHWLSANYTNLPTIINNALYENAKHLLHSSANSNTRVVSEPVSEPPARLATATPIAIPADGASANLGSKTKAELRQLVRDRFGPGTRFNDVHYARARKAELVWALAN